MFEEVSESFNCFSACRSPRVDYESLPDLDACSEVLHYHSELNQESLVRKIAMVEIET